MSELKKPEKFTIDRGKWLRGEGVARSKLLRASDGKMCCVGFYMLACGLDAEAIMGRSAVCDLVGYSSAAEVFMDHEVAVKSVYQPNDELEVDEAKREEMIREGFAKIGVGVEFVG